MAPTVEMLLREEAGSMEGETIGWCPLSSGGRR